MWNGYDNKNDDDNDDNDNNDDGQRTNFDRKSSLEPSAQVNEMTIFPLIAPEEDDISKQWQQNQDFIN